MRNVTRQNRRGAFPAAVWQHRRKGFCRVLAHGVILTGLVFVGVLAVPAGLLLLLISGVWAAADRCAEKLEGV